MRSILFTVSLLLFSVPIFAMEITKSDGHKLFMVLDPPHVMYVIQPASAPGGDLKIVKISLIGLMPDFHETVIKGPVQQKTYMNIQPNRIHLTKYAYFTHLKIC